MNIIYVANFLLASSFHLTLLKVVSYTGGNLIRMSELKKFDIPCFFNGAKQPITVFIGDSAPDHHPLHFQAEWITKDKGGQIPPDIMATIAKIQDLAKKNNVPFMELWQYALEASSNRSVEQGGEIQKSKGKSVEQVQQSKA